MNDLKFSCPSCGQHIVCDESHAGEKLPCPSCAALVRVPADAAIVTNSTGPATTPPAVPIGAGVPTVPTLEENFLEEAGTPLPTAPPMTEREQQIADARAAHPMQSGPALKPRLSFILSGGQAPVPEDNQSALQTEHKVPDCSSKDTSLSE
jgi:hypothetical protein